MAISTIQEEIYKVYNKGHPFHIIESSYYPLTISSNLFLFIFLFVYNINNWCSNILLYFSFYLLIYNIVTWVNKLWFESRQGKHTLIVQENLKLGFLLFIVTEIMFFFSLFWVYFSHAFSAPVTIGCSWPPYGLHVWVQSDFIVNIPLINSLILISSGLWADTSKNFFHRGNYTMFLLCLQILILLGVWFLNIQMFEFFSSTISISDTIYGTVLYFITGFHGFHVFFGLVCLSFILLKTIKEKKYLTRDRFVSFNCFIWYWHFVDYVWLFVWYFIYLWATI